MRRGQPRHQTLGACGFAVPDWFAPAQDGGDVPAIVLAESAGANLHDLLAAVQLALEDTRMAARVAVADDARDPAVAVRVAEAARGWGADVVIGHYGARTALPASRTYGSRGVLFLAPGTSADGLCGPAAPTTWQCFGRDAEQVECLAAAAAGLARVAVLAEPANYGADLARALHARLTGGRAAPRVDLHVAADLGGLRVAPGVECLFVFGSKEHAARHALDAAIVPAAVPLVFADECAGAAFLRTPRIAARSRVAHLARTGRTLLDRPAAAVAERAAALLMRPPGPYFETSYLATRAFLQAWADRCRGTAATCAHLLAQRWQTPFGHLAFDAARRWTGHRWSLHTPAPEAQDDPCCSLECR